MGVDCRSGWAKWGAFLEACRQQTDFPIRLGTKAGPHIRRPRLRTLIHTITSTSGPRSPISLIIRWVAGRVHLRHPRHCSHHRIHSRLLCQSQDYFRLFKKPEWSRRGRERQGVGLNQHVGSPSCWTLVLGLDRWTERTIRGRRRNRGLKVLRPRHAVVVRRRKWEGGRVDDRVGKGNPRLTRLIRVQSWTWTIRVRMGARALTAVCPRGLVAVREGGHLGLDGGRHTSMYSGGVS